MGFKYIIINDGFSDIPVIFPDRICHDTMAKAIIESKELNITGKKCKVVSAGEIKIDVLGCDGGSVTLKKRSRGRKDTDMINRYPYFHGR